MDFIEVDNYMKAAANIPKAYWSSLPTTLEIFDSEKIKKNFSRYVDVPHVPLRPNIYIFGENCTDSEKIAVQILLSCIKRRYTAYCVSTSVMHDTLDSKQLKLCEGNNGFESLSRVPFLAILGLGEEARNDFGRGSLAIAKIVEGRFFSGLPTIFASSLSPKQLSEDNYYPNLLPLRINQNSIIISNRINYSNQVESDHV
jgi:hypothetical protein